MDVANLKMKISNLRRDSEVQSKLVGELELRTRQLKNEVRGFQLANGIRSLVFYLR